MAKGPKNQAVSERLPVARVAVDISLAHLDRPFDYLVPASMDQTAVPGCRVRVRFAGQLVDGYLLDRVQASEHQGKLVRLERVISPEPVLTPEIFDLARAVADRYAGTLADVLRLAIPPRHATAEREAPAAPPVTSERCRKVRRLIRSAGSGRAPGLRNTRSISRRVRSISDMGVSSLVDCPSVGLPRPCRRRLQPEGAFSSTASSVALPAVTVTFCSILPV